jgi:hypothetical protein
VITAAGTPTDIFVLLGSVSVCRAHVTTCYTELASSGVRRGVLKVPSTSAQVSGLALGIADTGIVLHGWSYEPPRAPLGFSVSAHRQDTTVNCVCRSFGPGSLPTGRSLGPVVGLQWKL